MTAQMSVRIPLALKFSLAHSLFRGGFFVIINNRNVKKHSAKRPLALKKNFLFFLRLAIAKFLIRVLELVDRENLSFSDIIS